MGVILFWWTGLMLFVGVLLLLTIPALFVAIAGWGIQQIRNAKISAEN